MKDMKEIPLISLFPLSPHFLILPPLGMAQG
jgi:hypothetical protein